VGGGAPVSVQSMTNTDTRDAAATLGQVGRLAAAGCEIVRVAVPDRAAASALGEIVARSPIPVVADIHFDHALALASIDAGCAGVRLNPGNLADSAKMAEVAVAARAAGVPIRVGVNSGSLPREGGRRPDQLDPAATAELMAVCAVEYARRVEGMGQPDVIISAKSSDVPTTVMAYRLIAERCDYPLHLGVTATGSGVPAVVRSAVGIGSLLLEGIGDTLRVSLSGDPADEVEAGWEILAAAGLRCRGAHIVACPTCGRCEVDLPAIVARVRSGLAALDVPDGLSVAVMGCPVNGPGEAGHCDVGVACAAQAGLIFRRGCVVRKVGAGEVVEALLAEVRDLCAGKTP